MTDCNAYEDEKPVTLVASEDYWSGKSLPQSTSSRLHSTGWIICCKAASFEMITCRPKPLTLLMTAPLLPVR
jgi:hypothetical protein